MMPLDAVSLCLRIYYVFPKFSIRDIRKWLMIISNITVALEKILNVTRKWNSRVLILCSSRDKRDIDVIKENSRFVWEEKDNPETW